MPLSIEQKKLSTKDQLARSLYQLTEQQDFGKITIYQILERAGVSRRTFYRYFSSKDDLMDYCLTCFVDEYYQEKKNFFNAKRSQEVFLVTLDFMYKKRLFLRSLIKSGHYDLFASKFNDNSIIIYKTFGLPWNLSGELNTRDLDYVSKGLIGAYLNILKFWLVKDEPEEPAIIAKDIELLFSSIPNYFQNYHSED